MCEQKYVRVRARARGCVRWMCARALRVRARGCVRWMCACACACALMCARVSHVRATLLSQCDYGRFIFSNRLAL